MSMNWPDAALGGEVADGPGQEGPVRPRPGDHLRALPDDVLSRPPVGGVVVFPADYLQLPLGCL